MQDFRIGLSRVYIINSKKKILFFNCDLSQSSLMRSDRKNALKKTKKNLGCMRPLKLF